MKIILMGEPMGLFMANETGSLSEVNTFTASIAGAEYNVAVGLARLGHTPAYCTRLGFDPLGERILNGICTHSGFAYLFWSPTGLPCPRHTNKLQSFQQAPR